MHLYRGLQRKVHDTTHAILVLHECPRGVRRGGGGGGGGGSRGFGRTPLLALNFFF